MRGQFFKDESRDAEIQMLMIKSVFDPDNHRVQIKNDSSKQFLAPPATGIKEKRYTNSLFEGMVCDTSAVQTTARRRGGLFGDPSHGTRRHGENLLAESHAESRLGVFRTSRGPRPGILEFRCAELGHGREHHPYRGRMSHDGNPKCNGGQQPAEV